MDELDAGGKFDDFDRDTRRAMRNAIVTACVGAERFGITLQPDDPKNPFSYIRRGTAYEKKGDAASAIGDYRQVLKLVDADTGAEYAAKIRKLEKIKK